VPPLIHGCINVGIARYSITNAAVLRSHSMSAPTAHPAVSRYIPGLTRREMYAAMPMQMGPEKRGRRSNPAGWCINAPGQLPYDPDQNAAIGGEEFTAARSPACSKSNQPRSGQAVSGDVLVIVAI
jgi:hypothetical protein